MRLRPPARPQLIKCRHCARSDFPGPSIKLPPLEALPLGARLAIARVEERLAVTRSGAYVPVPHLAPLDFIEPDFVAVAERFLGVPYLWGGKTALGIDCSGLVQVALTAAGHVCPRDSDMQEGALGAPVARRRARAAPAARRPRFLERACGHRARPGTLIHANAFHMAVAIEPFAEAVARIRDAGSEITSVRRIG